MSEQETTNEGGYVIREHSQRHGKIYDGVPVPEMSIATSKEIIGFRLVLGEYSGGETGKSKTRLILKP